MHWIQLSGIVADWGRRRSCQRLQWRFQLSLGLGLSKNILDLNNFCVGNLSHDKRSFRSVQGMLVMRVKLSKHLMFTMCIVVCIIQNWKYNSVHLKCTWSRLCDTQINYFNICQFCWDLIITRQTWRQYKDSGVKLLYLVTGNQVIWDGLLDSSV